MSEIQYGLLPELEKQLQAAQEVESKGFTLLQDKVTAEEIAQVVSRWTGIPVSKMLEGERDKLLQMEAQLHTRVIGQDEAIKAVSDAVRRSRAGLSDPNRPSGSFLFLGPTGVGKTELCKALAEFLFDSSDAMVRIDMAALRNVFARHELETALYYLRRGAYVAAIDRAKYLLETYPQSDAQNDAIAVLAEAYTGLGNQTLAADARRVLQQNDPNHPWLTGDWPHYPSKIRTLNPFASEKPVSGHHH